MTPEIRLTQGGIVLDPQAKEFFKVSGHEVLIQGERCNKIRLITEGRLAYTTIFKINTSQLEVFSESAGEARLDYRLGKDSRVRVYNKSSTAVSHQLNVIATQGSQFSFFGNHQLAHSTWSIRAQLAEHAVVFLSALTHARIQDQMRTEIEVRHLGAHSTSRQLFYSYAEDNSTVDFSGKIYVEKNASKVIADQMHKGTLLSRGARIRSEPFLSILHDDVKCTHGSSTGALSTDQLHYLRSRGLTLPEAREMLIQSYRNSFYAKIENLQAREFLGFINHE